MPRWHSVLLYLLYSSYLIFKYIPNELTYISQNHLRSIVNPYFILLSVVFPSHSYVPYFLANRYCQYLDEESLCKNFLALVFDYGPDANVQSDFIIPSMHFKSHSFSYTYYQWDFTMGRMLLYKCISHFIPLYRLSGILLWMKKNCLSYCRCAAT